jgi:rubrerythrin
VLKGAVVPQERNLKQIIGVGTKDVLEVCQTVEFSCAELYHHFAELFKDDRSSLLLWLKTAMEEENHARLFALVAKLRRSNIVESIRIDLADAEVALLYVRSLIDRVKKTPPTQLEALRIAIDLEKKLDGFMMGNVIGFADHTHEKSFLAITNADNRHLESLQEAYDRLSGASGA